MLDAALGAVKRPSPDEKEHGIDHDLELLGTIPRTDNFLVEGYIDLDVVQHLPRLREYDVVRRLLCGEDTCSCTKRAVEAARILRFLAFHGYHDLLSRIFESTNPPDYTLAEEAEPADSLLFTACQRPMPNMEVVRLIIDKMHGSSMPKAVPMRIISTKTAGMVPSTTQKNGRESLAALSTGGTRLSMSLRRAGTGGMLRREYRICCHWGPRSISLMRAG